MEVEISAVALYICFGDKKVMLLHAMLNIVALYFSVYR